MTKLEAVSYSGTVVSNSAVEEESMRNRTRLLLAALWIGLVSAVASSAPARHDSRVQLKLDSSEADQVLAILDLRAAGRPIDVAASRTWRKNCFCNQPSCALLWNPIIFAAGIRRRRANLHPSCQD